MTGLVSILVTFAYIAAVAYLVVKKYNSVWVFLMTGLGVMLLFAFAGQGTLGDSTTGNLFIDAFVFVKNQFTSNFSGQGFNIMIVSGYATYMAYIGASTKLAFLATKPLSNIKNPYIVASLLLIIGSALKVITTSASGLGMLLMSVCYPILVSLGVSRLNAAAIVVLSTLLDWGPNDSSAIFAAETVCGMPIVDYFMQYQIPVGVCIIIAEAIFLPIYLNNTDKAAAGEAANIKEEDKVQDATCPAWYSVLPLLPLVLIIVSSTTELLPKLDVATANILCLVIVLVLQLITIKDKKAAMEDMKFVFTKMGVCAANIVSILIAAAVFAQAVKMLNGVTELSNMLATLQGATIISVVALSLITFLTGMILGSGNAAWYAFGPLVPDIATKLGIAPTVISTPMQLAPAIGRSMSPVAGVVIAVAGMAEVDVQDLIKRCALPVILAFVVCIIASLVITAL